MMRSCRFVPIKGKCAEIVEYLLASPDMPSDEGLLFKLRLCCEEAVQNVVDYAYEDGAGYLEAGTSRQGDILEIVLMDSGRPFNPLEKEAPDITASLEDRQVGGLGIYLCTRMMDSVSYSYEQGCNVLRMTMKDTNN